MNALRCWVPWAGLECVKPGSYQWIRAKKRLCYWERVPCGHATVLEHVTTHVTIALEDLDKKGIRAALKKELQVLGDEVAGASLSELIVFRDLCQPSQQR